MARRVNIIEKVFMKWFEHILIKALEQEGKEPTTENIAAFIGNVLEEKNETDN